MPVVSGEEELVRLVKSGWSVQYDSTNDRYKLYNPETKERILVARHLNPIAKLYYKGRRTERDGRGEGEVSGASNPLAGGPSLDDDRKLFLELLRGKVNSRTPVWTLMVMDAAWFEKVKRSVGVCAMAEFWPESSEEIDLEDPKATAMRIVRRMRAAKELASKARELEAKLVEERAKVEEKYRAELEAYKEKVRELEEAIGKYKYMVDELLKMVDFLTEKAKKTNFYLLYTLPLYLTEEDRPLHYMIVNKLKEIWCPEELAKAEQGRASPTTPSAR
jgi:hypothetical protein